MPVIERHGKGWSFRVGYTVNGRRVQKRFSGYATKESAEKAMLAEQLRVKRGQVADAEGHTVESWLEYWFDNHASLKIEATTAAKYEMGFKKIVPAIGSIPLDKLRAAHIQPMIADWARRYKPASVHTYIMPLRVALNHAVRMEILDRNPCDRVTLPPLKSEPKAILSPDQINTLLDEIRGKPLYIQVLLVALAGLRRGEVAGLTWGDVDIDKGVLRVTRSRVPVNGITHEKAPKTPSSIRAIAIPNQLSDALRDIGGPEPVESGYVCQVNGGPMRPDYMNKALKSVIKRLGLPQVSPHGLRHSHASIMLYLGVHPKVVQERLGHSKISITMDTYSHVMAGMQEDAAAKIGNAILGVSPKV